MRILYAEDERDLNDLVTRRLVAEGYGVDSCLDGQQAWDYLQAADYDAAILDIMMPHLDGLSVLKKLRAAGKTTPVLLLTARDAIADRVAGLDSGANDYLVKPFGVMEMVSRVKAVLRRCHPADTGHVLSAGGLSMDLDCRTVTADGQRLQLTYKEFELLRLFLSHPGMAFTREQLFTQVWNMEYMDDSRTLDMHIRTLRQKLGAYGKLIETVRNVGYRMETGL